MAFQKRWPRPMCPASGTAGADDAVDFAERSPGLLVGPSNAKPPKEVPNEEVPHEEVPHGVKCNVRNPRARVAQPALCCSRGRPTCKVWLEAMRRRIDRSRNFIAHSQHRTALPSYRNLPIHAIGTSEKAATTLTCTIPTAGATVAAPIAILAPPEAESSPDHSRAPAINSRSL